MKKIAFITSEDDPNLSKDDQFAIEPLHKLGYQVSPLIWDNPLENAGVFDALIFRSCWNYHRKYSQFVHWVERLKRLDIPILNPVDISLWNLDKKYLIELEKKNILIPQTYLIHRTTQVDDDTIKSIQEKISTSHLVIKPTVSLNGHDTYLLPSQDDQAIIKTLKSLPVEHDILIQEFIPEIKSSGEISLIYFNNEFSHAIRKTPAPQEFRIHSEYGGSRVAFQPDSVLVQQGKKILETVGQTLLFARVDIIETQNGAVLIELEIIDPMLFLGYSSQAPQRFAEAIANALKT